MVEIVPYEMFFEDDTIPICVFRMPYTELDRQTHAHEFHEIMIVESGVATHHYRDHDDTIVMGDVFVIPPFQFHGYEMKDNCGVNWRRMSRVCVTLAVTVESATVVACQSVASALGQTPAPGKVLARPWLARRA